jgi:hypothetical protein
MREVALKVCAIAEFDVQAAVEYVTWKGRVADADEVKGWLAALAPNERLSILTPSDDQPRAHRQLREARKFWEEKKVVTWVQTQSRSKAIAPTPGAVIDEAAGTAGPSGRRSSRYKWLRRVSGRWGGRKCVFALGDQLTSELLEEKVLHVGH